MRVIGALIILVASACSRTTPPPRKPVDPVARGEYLVKTLGCPGCHAAPLDLGTEEQFITAMRRPLAAPMPWLNAAAASDADLEAMFAYLGRQQVAAK